MSVYKPISILANDQSIIKPLNQVSIRNRELPVMIGSRFNSNIIPPENAMIQNFNVPQYIINPSNFLQSNWVDQSGHSIPEKCPIEGNTLRNQWESFNNTNSVAFGGFDQYNINDIPSCSDRNGDYMNFIDYATLPFNRTIVYKNTNNTPVIFDTH